jgi:DNA-binding SARP family transcriptional activator
MIVRREASNSPHEEDNNSSSSDEQSATYQYTTAVRILEQVQSDYSMAKNQLDSMSNLFSKKEAATREQIQRLIPALKENSSTVRNRKIVSDKAKEIASGSVARTITSLQAFCFGNFEVHLNWRKCEGWHSLKAKTLLKFLVSNRSRPVPKDVLIEMLWPDCDPEAGSNNLKSAVYALRQMFSGSTSRHKTYSPIVVYSDGNYFIDPELNLWVDVDEFEQCWLAGRRLDKTNEMEQAVKQFQLADELYRGDYLEDELYTEWTLLRREALKDTYLAILAKLINASFKSGDYENCIVYSQKILAKDSCHEEAYQWLIRCHSRLGQRHRAKQWFNLCVATLKKELNTAPNRKTATLYHQLVNEEPSSANL